MKDLKKLQLWRVDNGPGAKPRGRVDAHIWPKKGKDKRLIHLTMRQAKELLDRVDFNFSQ